MKRWIEPSEVNIPSEVLNTVHGNQLIAGLLARRGIIDVESFLDPEMYMPASPYDLPDMDKAVVRIERAISKNEQICIWGDFDVDGQTSTSLLVSALRGLGANVQYYIPHRLLEGHGIHIPRLEQLINDDGIQLLITCDTGIAAHEAIDFANSHNVDVIITDHHQLTPELPIAVAAVNPQRLPEDHPLRTLAGVGCAYKVIEALYMRVGRASELPRFLDLVAMGLVADVVPLVDDTRYLVQKGLQSLRNTQRLGLKMMLEQAGVPLHEITEETIGFTIGPRLNALGRLDDANVSVEILTTDDVERARTLAIRMEQLNEQRKLLSDQVFQAAQQQIEQNPKLLDYAALVLGNERWPGGVVGIVANRLVEVYNRPVILLVIEPNKLARGSARSIPGVDIAAAIASHADLLEGFGGHTMAAGLSLHPENLTEFRIALSRTVDDILDSTDVADRLPELPIDAFLSLDDVSLDFVEQLNQLAPFGAGNPLPVFATPRLTLKSHRFLGRSQKHVRLTVEDEQGNAQEVVWWRADMDLLPPGRFDLAYTMQINTYKDKRDVQLVFEDVRPVDEEPQEFAHRAEVEIVDYRHLNESQQLEKLQQLDSITQSRVGAQHDVPDKLPKDPQPSVGASEAHPMGRPLLVWSEVEKPETVESVQRRDLTASQALAIWTIPPSSDLLRQALEIVNPATVYLFGINPKIDSVQAFLHRFAGLVKHVLNNKDGKTTIQVLGGGMAQREATIRAGLQWMAARGHINIVKDENGELELANSEAQSSDNTTDSTVKLATLLRETAAFRGHYLRSDAESIIGKK